MADRRGIGTVAKEAILAGKTNEQALEAVKAEFPDSRAKLSSMNWYRQDLRKKGHDVQSGRDARKADSEDF